MITIWVGNLSKNLKIQIKRVCPKCQKVFYCDNSCASINKNCLCAKCFKGAGNTGLVVVNNLIVGNHLFLGD
jgi:hypothetical protein